MSPVLVTWRGGAFFGDPTAVTRLVADHTIVTVHVGWRAIAAGAWRHVTRNAR